MMVVMVGQMLNEDLNVKFGFYFAISLPRNFDA